jgi:hypothetical protein
MATSIRISSRALVAGVTPKIQEKKHLKNN